MKGNNLRAHFGIEFQSDVDINFIIIILIIKLFFF